MSNTEQVLTLAEKYREELQEANDRDTIRAKQRWFRDQAAPLFTSNDHNKT
jgi:hypothetical protein